jgi:hypothetical protein
VAARPKRKPSGRRRGGQPGHRGTTRSLLPPEKVTRIVDLRPETCDRCGRALSGSDPKPIRSQVTDLPPVEPDITEYRRHTLPCECGAEAAATGKALVEQAKLMFRWWHEFKAGSLSRSGFQERMGPLIERVEAFLEEGAASGHKKTAGRCREILKLRAALWTFVAREGVEPTDNAAERALRPAVIWREGSFGSASERGSRFVERMLTVAATCRQQGQNVLDHLVAACEAHARGEPAPSLLPQVAEERLAA